MYVCIYIYVCVYLIYLYIYVCMYVCMYAGPILFQKARLLAGNEKTPALLTELFEEGTRVLIKKLPEIFSGTVETVVQDDCLASHAPKIVSSESNIRFSESNALAIHNKVR